MFYSKFYPSPCPLPQGERVISGFLKNSQGAILIEMAVALPVLLILILGGIEIGLYLVKQRIVGRTVDSAIIPLQMNPLDVDREIEKQARNSGMGFVDFSLGNEGGNYICAKPYPDFESAKRELCSVQNTSENGWHPEQGIWVQYAARPYYLVILAHAPYHSIVGINGVLPDMNEYHIFQVNPSFVMTPPRQTITVPSAPASTGNSPQLGGNNCNSNPNQDLERAVRQFKNMLSGFKFGGQR